MANKGFLGGIFNKKERLNTLIVNGVGGIVRDNLDLVEGKRYAANDVTCEAWAVDEANQFIDKLSGLRTQLVSAWNNRSIPLFGDKKDALTKTNINAIAARVTDEEITWKDEDRKKKGRSQLLLGIITTALVVCVIIPVLMQACG
jgi:hypothetical protein